MESVVKVVKMTLAYAIYIVNLAQVMLHSVFIKTENNVIIVVDTVFNGKK